MNILLIYCVTFLMLISGNQKSNPETFNEVYKRFQNYIEDGDYLNAYKSLHESMEIFWDKSPLILNNVQFVMSGNNSFGIYEPRMSDTFKSGENIYLYIEPIGYAMKKSPKGYYEFGFTADYSLVNADGEMLAGQEDFADLHFKSWNFNTEISMTFTYTFSGFEKGKYKIVTTVKDKFSGKKTTVENYFNFQ